MSKNIFSIDFCIDNEHSKAQFFEYLYEYAIPERELLKKLKIKDILRASSTSYYQIQKFKEGSEPISLEAYFKLVKYARQLVAQSR